MELANKDELLEQARILVEQLESGQEQEVHQTLEKLTYNTNNELFREVGQITRELHDSIKTLLSDGRLEELAEKEIPDATERLNYVIQMTEESANTTMNSVETGMSLSEEMSQQAQQLLQDWGRFQAREITVEEFRKLCSELTAFMEQIDKSSEVVREKLTDVLMAQSFQDLTGQVIRKVITSVHEVEEKLVKLIKISSTHIMKDETAANQSAELAGPNVPGVEQGEQVSGQDEVDDLLASLGF